MTRALPVAVDLDAGSPINTQLKEQIRWLIVLGELKPGDRLPTVQDLADSLRINRNTVAQVYSELGQEGYLVARPRYGTSVADSEVVRRAVQGAELGRIIDGALDRALALGFTPPEFAAAAAARASMQMALRQNRKALFLECTWAEVEHFSRTIEEETGMTTQGMHLYDARKDPAAFRAAAGTVDVVITTLFHLEELQEMAGPEIEVMGIGAGPELQFLRSLAQLPRGTSVAICCVDQDRATRVRTYVANSGVQHLNMVAVGVDAAEKLEEALKDVQYVYVSRAAYPEARRILGEPAKLRPYRFQLDRAGIEMLKARLAERYTR